MDFGLGTRVVAFLRGGGQVEGWLVYGFRPTHVQKSCWRWGLRPGVGVGGRGRGGGGVGVGGGDGGWGRVDMEVGRGWGLIDVEVGAGMNIVVGDRINDRWYVIEWLFDEELSLCINLTTPLLTLTMIHTIPPTITIPIPTTPTITSIHTTIPSLPPHRIPLHQLIQPILNLRNLLIEHIPTVLHLPLHLSSLLPYLPLVLLMYELQHMVYLCSWLLSLL